MKEKEAEKLRNETEEASLFYFRGNLKIPSSNKKMWSIYPELQ